MNNNENSSNVRVKRKSVSYSKYGYLFILPFFIAFLIFQLWPLLTTFYYSVFSCYRRFGIEYKSFCGMKNFMNVLGITQGETPYFLTYLKNTLVLWIANFVPQILLSLLMAAWLTDSRIKTKGRGIVKILIYMPNIITAASISVMFYSMFCQFGPVTSSIRSLGWISNEFDFMRSVGGTRGIIAFILTWMWYGNTSLLLIAGMLGISPSLYEAADMDGASGFKKFTKITIPSLKPILLYVLVTSAIGGLQMYDIPALFNVSTNGTLIGLPDDKTTTILMYIMRLHNDDVGKAAAVSVLLFAVSLIISLFLFASMREKKEPRIKHAIKATEGV